MDALTNGRRIKCLTCVDDFTKECLTIAAAFGISGVQVTRILDSIALIRDYGAESLTAVGLGGCMLPAAVTAGRGASELCAD